MDSDIEFGSVRDMLGRVLGGGIGPIIALVLLLFLGYNSFEIVGAGERGVVFSTFGGVQQGVRGEGLQLKVPFIQTIIPIDVRIQKAETDSSASSKDLQTVQSRIALNYHIAPEQAWQIYQEVGTLYKERLIDPSVQEAVKAATAQFTAEELITRRSEVSDEIREMLKERLVPHNIIVDEFNIVDFNFSSVFNEAIEAKQTAEQDALRAERELDRIKIEAEQTITAAQAEAESQRLQRETLTEELLQFRAIERWDGVLPQVVGGAVPFINLETMSAR